MTRLTLIIPALVALLVSGCSKTVWNKPGATRGEFNVQSAHCRLVARGAAPNVYIPPSPTYTHSGTVTTPSGTGYYSGTSTPGPNNAALGAALGTAWARQGAYDDCMIVNGYTKKNEEKSWWKDGGSDDLVECQPSNKDFFKFTATRKDCYSSNGTVIRVIE